VVVIEQNR